VNDTSPEAERVLTDVYRRMPAWRKWQILGEMYADARAMHAAGIRARNPQATDRDVLTAWLRTNLGYPELEPRGDVVTNQPINSLHELRLVVRIFARLGVPYVLGGSMASSIHGVDRYTRDADITVEGLAGKEEQLPAAFGSAFYMSLDAIKDAVRRHSSFNIINVDTGFKVDVFIPQETPFEHSALARRRTVTMADQPDEPIVLYSPEDVILFKLRRYRLGNEVSGQQLQDVYGVFRSQGNSLDQAYLDRWAADLGVTDLLARARTESAL
jgi:hypothetical protein